MNKILRNRKLKKIKYKFFLKELDINRFKFLNLNKNLKFKDKSLLNFFLLNKYLIKKKNWKTMAYNYCFLTGRSKGYFRTSGLSRIKFKEYNSNGYLPGFRKSSW